MSAPEVKKKLDVMDPNNIFLLLGFFTTLSMVTKLFASECDSAFIGLVCQCGAAFVVTGKILYETRLTQAIGEVLVGRVTYMTHNWRNESLRSTVEAGAWLSAISWSLNATERRDLAVVHGTLAGVFIALLGEYLTKPISNFELILLRYFGESDKDNKKSLASSIPILSIYAYYAITQVVAFANNIFMMIVLATAAGLALILLSMMANAWKPTRNLGESLNDRLFNFAANWRKFPMRSMAELSTFLGVTLHIYAESQDFMFAVRAGVASGSVVCLLGDAWVKCCCCNLVSATEDERVRLVPTGFMAYFVILTCNFCFKDVPTMLGRRTLPFWLQLFMATSGALTYIMLGRLFMRLPGTKFFGAVLQHRMTHVLTNWDAHPLRSALECGATNLISWTVWYRTDGNLTWFVTTIIVSGPLMVLCSCFVDRVRGVQPVTLPFKYNVAVRKRSSTSFVPEPVDSVEPMIEATSQQPVGKMPSPTTKSGKTKSNKPLMTWAEFSKHNSPKDAYLLIQGEVYDVTKWLDQHPGGSIIAKYAGADATDQFAAFHRPKVAHRLKAFHVATLAPDSGEPAMSSVTKDYRDLRDFLYSEGFFKPNPEYYNGRHAIWLGMVVTSVCMVLFANSWAGVLLGAVLMGLGWQQAGFLAHDAAHHGIQDPPKRGHTNMLAWFLGNVVFGISANMWNEEHSAHHAITIRPREDPQFNYLPLFMISEKELHISEVDGPKGYQFNPFSRASVAVQHFVFLPVAVLIGRVNIYAISIVFEIKMLFIGLAGMCGLVKSDADHRLMAWQATLGLIGLACFHYWHVAVLFMLPSNTERLVFFAVSHWVAGILHIQLLLSHMNVDTFTKEEERAEGFAAFQVRASRNIDCWEYEHWFHGGLEYQIEHHLFPQLPRHALAQVQPYVKDFCAKHKLPYRIGGFAEVTCDVVSHLKELGTAIVTLDQ